MGSARGDAGRPLGRWEARFAEGGGCFNLIVLAISGTGFVISLGHVVMGLIALVVGDDATREIGLRFAASGAAGAVAFGSLLLGYIKRRGRR